MFNTRIVELGPAYDALPLGKGDGVQKRIIIDQVKDGLSFLVVDLVTHTFSPQHNDDIESKIIDSELKTKKKIVSSSSQKKETSTTMARITPLTKIPQERKSYSPRDLIVLKYDSTKFTHPVAFIRK